MAFIIYYHPLVSSDKYFAIFLAEFERIRHQIEQDLLQASHVGAHHVVLLGLYGRSLIAKVTRLERVRISIVRVADTFILAQLPSLLETLEL